MPMVLRYVLAAFIMLAAAIFAIAPFTPTFVEQWARRRRASLDPCLQFSAG